MTLGMNAIRGAGPAGYIGQQAFGVDDATFFFGRARERAALGQLLLENPVVVLYGPAGCGRTSLLQAGLPAELQDKGLVLPPGRVWGSSFFPEAALAMHNRYTLAVLSGWSPADSRASLAPLSLTDFLTDPGLASGQPAAASGLVFAVIDQLEEVFAGSVLAEHRDAFFADLALALQAVPGLRVVLSVRDDHLDGVRQYQELLGIRPEAFFLLGPLSRAAALDAVRGPAEQAGFQFGAGVIEHLVDSLVADGQVEPVQLQVASAALLQSLPPGVRTVMPDLTAVTSIAAHALAQFCAGVLADTAAEHDIGTAGLRDWVTSTFITPQGTRAVADAARTAVGQLASIVHGLANRHLLTSTHRPGGTQSYLLANDLLVKALQEPGELLRPEPAPQIDAATHLKIAAELMARQEFTLAEKHARYALECSDDQNLRRQADAWSLLGNVAFERDHFGDAEDRYRQAAELSEQVQDQVSVGRLLGAIGQLHARRGEHMAALEDLQSAVARVPGDLALQADLAHALWRTGQAHAAVAVFGTVLTLEPEFAEALAGRGQISAENGNASSALSDFRALRRLRPSMGRQPELRSAYALALARTGQPDTAMAEADAAVASAQDNGPIFLRAARVARVSGAFDRASSLLQLAAQASNPALSSEQLDEARRLLTSAVLPDS
jgi:tetratricopeptide (TPR) repeat protein